MKILTIIKNIPLIFWMWRKGIKSKTIKQWAKEYFDAKVSLDIKPTKPHFFIGFIARYGVGKTTVAKKIVERLPFVSISSDEGRRFLQQRGVSSDIVGKEKLVFLMGLKVIQELMQRRINVLLDADLRQSHFRESLQNLITSQGYEFLLVQVVTKDSIVLERINQRKIKEESEYLRENMERHFMDRKKIHETELMPSVFFTFNNDGNLKDLDEQIDRFVIKFGETFGIETDKN